MRFSADFNVSTNIVSAEKGRNPLFYPGTKNKKQTKQSETMSFGPPRRWPPAPLGATHPRVSMRRCLSLEKLHHEQKQEGTNHVCICTQIKGYSVIPGRGDAAQSPRTTLPDTWRNLSTAAMLPWSTRQEGIHESWGNGLMLLIVVARRWCDGAARPAVHQKHGNGTT